MVGMPDAQNKKSIAWKIYIGLLLFVVCIAVIVAFYYAYSQMTLPAINLSNKIDEYNDASLNNNYEEFMEEYDALNFIQQKYVPNIVRVEDVHKAFQEEAANATLTPITPEQIERAQANAEVVAEKRQQAQSETTAVNSGEMPKDYKPIGNEPNWIEITAYLPLPIFLMYRCTKYFEAFILDS